uniref:Uncharacterized protein n=1 Tax=viral metagenome TaxID=1070528 RepID=A0A6M3JZ92_9ZZZZ
MNLSPHYNPNNNLASMPFTWIGLFYNGGCPDPCDMLSGPCACGAWHHQYEWPDVLQVSVFGNVQVDEDYDRLFGRRKRR